MYRFVENSWKKRVEREHGELKVHELEKAEKIIVKFIQLDSFSSEDVKNLQSISVFKGWRNFENLDKIKREKRF